MSRFRCTTSCWLIVQALCFCLLLQGSGIAQALPLPPKPTFVSKDELDAARLRRAAAGTDEAKPGLLKRFVGDAWDTAAAAGSRIQDWLEDAWAPASSAASPEALLRIALAGGTVPLPSRLMPAVFAVPLQGQGAPPGPPSRAGAEIEATPPAEAAKLREKAGTDEIPLVAGWNLISIPLEPADPDPAAVFGPIAGQLARVEHNDVCDPDDPWKYYLPGDPAASNLTAVTPGMGLWIKVTTATLLPVDGTLPATTTIDLCPGWNHIGMPTGEPRHPQVALSSIAGKWQRVYSHDAFNAESPWALFDTSIPYWYNDLPAMRPGYGYWVLATEAATLTISNQGPPPTVALAAPADLSVVTQPTEVTGTVDSDRLESWTLTSRPIGDGAPVTLATGNAPVAGAAFATFDPTLLLNGLYELELTATDVQGQQVTESIAVTVEGQMKIGHFTLSFVDLAIPVSGLDIEIGRRYDSRDKEQRDFGVGWSLEVRQGYYVNNRPPGDGWQFQTGLVPCEIIQESKSHLTVVRLSDQEVYRFAVRLFDGASTGGGCFAEARFDFVDGPLPGSTLEILGSTRVFWENGGDRVIDADSFELYEPEDVRLTTRDGRIFELDLDAGVTKLEDLNGNQLTITPAGITHSSGVGIDFVRDAEGRIQEIVDLRANSNLYAYDGAGDLVRHTDRAGGKTQFTYRDHYLEDVHNALGVRAVRSEYDDAGRLIRHVDADGKVIELSHDLEQRQEIVTNRLGQSRQLEYDGRGNVVRDVDESGAVTERSFDNDDNLLTEKDPLGHVTTYTYTAENDLASMTNALGETTAFTYNDRGQILTLTDPGGYVTTSTYDASGNLLSTTDALDQTTTFSYDGAGNLLSTTDILGHTTEMTYNARGDIGTETDALGHVSTHTYDSAGNRLSESRTRTLPGGSIETLTTSFEYDELDRVTATTAADGTVTRSSYDALGRVTSRTDQLGRVMTMDYNPLGQLVTTTYPDEVTESQTYDAEGRVLTRTDRAGRVTQMAYDAIGRLVTTTFPDGATQSQSYDPAGQLVSTTDARGNITTYAYDGAGRRNQVTDALEQTTSFGHDARGNQISMTDARGHTTEFAYDTLGRLTTTTYPDATTTQVGYDDLGRRISETDQAGITTQFAYDALGRLISVTDALDQVTSYTYDELGNRLTQTDTNGHMTSFEYDRLGRQIARILPDDARESMTYNDDGTLASHTDFNGDTRTFEYDVNRRLVRRTYPDGSEHRFSYTATGQRETATDSRGVTSYAYDARDWLVEKQDPNGHKLTYTYDPQGNLETLTATVSTESYTSSYGYDALNRQVTVTDPQGGVNALTYDANGNRAGLTHANGLVTTYDYDPLNRLTLLETRNGSSNVVQSYAYTLGPAGHRTRIDEADGTVRAYTYDAVYRLTQDRVTDSSGDLDYQQDFDYDPVGNRLSLTIDEGAGPTVINSAYDERDRLLAAGATEFNWDPSGSLSARNGEVLTWSFDQRLTSASLGDGTVVEIIYDVDGNQVRSRATSPDGTTATVDYLVDPLGQLSHVVGEVVNGSVDTLYTRSHDELISLLRPRNQQQLLFHSDALGSIRLITDQQGSTTDRYSYTAFGQAIEHDGDDTQPYRFAGEPLNRALRLQFHRARWMDPQHGHFVSMDPFPATPHNSTHLHRYLYASLDPLNQVDPSGLFASAVSFSVANAVRGIVSGIQIDVGINILTQPPLDPDGDISKTLLLLSLASGGYALLRNWQALLRSIKQFGRGVGSSAQRLFRRMADWARRADMSWPNGIPTSEGLEIATDLRQSLGLAFPKRNVAIAEVRVSGRKDLLYSVSGQASPPGTVPAPAARRFSTRTVRGAAPTANHSEVKILEEVAAGLSPNDSGTISLYTERQPCPSCEWPDPLGVIDQFKEAFPLIEVIVTWTD